jgi:hypothetical protein
MAVVRLTPMNLRVIAAIGAAGVAIAVGLPLAFAAPSSDGAGYVDSTARCAAPSTVVIFGQHRLFPRRDLQGGRRQVRVPGSANQRRRQADRPGTGVG